MKTLFILMNHILTAEQEADARINLKIDNFKTISDEGWANIDPSKESVSKIIEIYQDRLKEFGKSGDMLLVQGDFGATYAMVNFAKSIGIDAIYSTTRRIATEQIEDGKVVIKREFKHERFRKYE